MEWLRAVQALRRIFRSARDQERAGRHQGVQFVQIVSCLDQTFVGSRARIL